MSEFFKGFLSREIVSLTVMLAVLLVRLLFRRAEAADDSVPSRFVAFNKARGNFTWFNKSIKHLT